MEKPAGDAVPKEVNAANSLDWKQSSPKPEGSLGLEPTTALSDDYGPNFKSTEGNTGVVQARVTHEQSTWLTKESYKNDGDASFAYDFDHSKMTDTARGPNTLANELSFMQSRNTQTNFRTTKLEAGSKQQPSGLPASGMTPFLNSRKEEVVLLTEEDREAYIKEIDEAKEKIEYPNNPCLFTTSIKIHSHNIKIEKLKQKYKQNKAKQKMSTSVKAAIERLSPPSG